MDNEFPRAISCINSVVWWTVNFDDNLQHEHWKVMKEWMIGNCNGIFGEDFGLNAKTAVFREEHDAILFMVRFS